MGRIIFTGGGSGGHVFPGIAVYQHLPARDRSSVLWICSRDGIERSILRRTGIPTRSVPTGKLRRYVSVRNILDIGRIGAGIFAARRILAHVGADLVFSKGGFVAVPVVIAAWTLRIPIVIHESDATPGLATRISSLFARTICAGYPTLQTAFPGRRARRTVVTGNPVRTEFFVADASRALERIGLTDTGIPVLLVTGGSLGARQLNDLVAATIAELTEHAVVIHQTGADGEAAIASIAARARPGRYHGAATYADTFPALLRRADLAVARAGAGTIRELAVTGTPAILIPLSRSASRGDQIENAQRYADTGAAIVVSPDAIGIERFRSLVISLLTDATRRERCAAAARRSIAGNAALEIANRLTAMRDNVRDL
jgi:UDP-N-acetylglucosamine--N-acetylmuramyl-(pentapeptide) pyrophosphoryl-undecaprenol N-acetylglucosamine transferase